MQQPVDEALLRARRRIGRTVKGKWQIDALIGMGGMASVYAATHRNNSRVALKVLRLELSADADIRARFLREGYVANVIDHPGTVRVVDDDVDDDGSVFLVMELLEGESLADRLDRVGGRMAVQEALRLGADALDVVAAAHDKGVVHRDLKPDNVFLTSDGQVKVLDFGIARVRELSHASSATRTGAMMGTPAFMPPEQALGHSREIDARTDLWAMGATIFRMITGRNVHPGETPNELLIGAATRKAPSLSAVTFGAPTPLVEFLDKSLAFERDGRWPDARAMRSALQRVLESLPQEPLVLEPVTTLAGVPAGDASEVPTNVVRTEAIRHELPGQKRDWRVAVAIGAGAGIVVAVIAAILLRTLPGQVIVQEQPAAGSVPSPATAPAQLSASAAPTASAPAGPSSSAPPASSSAPKGTRPGPIGAPPPTGKDWLNRRH
ncbi:MAG: serine/threonine protein kinase [Deltaproteobacteria bacterium]|nr:serine/threonine protein kinase [Deltaproteobacteria bacterium]